MPFLNKVSGGSARKFGLSRRSAFWLCNTHPGVATLNNGDKKCYYPANYNATATTSQQQQGPACYSGGGTWGSEPNAGCCGCGGCPYEGCIGCFGVSCYCYTSNWTFLGTVGGWCYAPYYITVNVTTYSCPQNPGIATVSGTSCVYPSTYNATMYS